MAMTQTEIAECVQLMDATLAAAERSLEGALDAKSRATLEAVVGELHASRAALQPLAVRARSDGKRAYVRVKPEDARAWARGQGDRTWKQADFQAAFAISAGSACNHVRALAEAGIVEKVAPGTYRYVRPENNAPRVRPRGEPRIAEIAAAAPRRGAVVRHGRTRATRKDVEELLTAAERSGADVSQTKGGHFRVKTDAGVVIVPATPSDHRSLPNAKSALRRAGVPL